MEDSPDHVSSQPSHKEWAKIIADDGHLKLGQLVVSIASCRTHFLLIAIASAFAAAAAFTAAAVMTTTTTSPTAASVAPATYSRNNSWDRTL